MKRIFVLDACAVIALVKKERGADIVAGLYQRAASGSVQLCINRVNLLEVYYGFYYDKGRDYASNIIPSRVTKVLISSGYGDKGAGQCLTTTTQT